MICHLPNNTLSLNPLASIEYVVRAEHQNQKYAYTLHRFN